MSEAPSRDAAPAEPDSITSRTKSERAPIPAASGPAARPRPLVGLRATLAHIPTAAWICALIAFLNASAWSLIMPPFQGRDEVDHFAYAAQIAETGTLPKNGQAEGVYSPEEKLVLGGLNYYRVRFSSAEPTISTPAEQQALSEDVHAHASLVGSGEAGVATAEPPLFYALQTIPYFIGRGNILTQLQLMRVLDAILGAITALLCFLFVREALPGVRWAATVGGLCVALQPLFAFMSGSVNPDVLLFTLSAAIFLCLTRAFRVGFTWRMSFALGLLVAAGFLTKLNFIGFGIGVLFGLCALAVRAVRSRGWSALAPIGVATGIGFAPPLLYVLVNKLSGTAALGPTSENAEASSVEGVFHELSYVWELYLPRLPGMPRYFRGLSTFKDVWFDRSVGFYGWMDVLFPNWVDTVALFLAGAVALLVGHELLRRRDAIRTRALELATYAVITVGVLLVVGIPSYHTDIVGHIYAFGEPRYLLPMLPLLGAAIALAVRGARRWAPAVGAAMVVLFLAHDIFSQLQTIARYYG
jgi:4-amino-4-deoxy-L-arabinose transferase-like glycosyltransferase